MYHPNPTKLFFKSEADALYEEFKTQFTDGEFVSTGNMPFTQVAMWITNTSSATIRIVARGATESGFTIEPGETLETPPYDYPQGLPDVLGADVSVDIEASLMARGELRSSRAR